MEQTIGSDDRVAVGLRAFRTVKLTPEDAARDAWLASSADIGPRTVIIGLDGRVVTMLPLERVTASAVWEAMRSAVRTGYGADIDSLVERQREIQREFDRLESERRSLTISPFSDTQGATESIRFDERRRDLEAKERAIWTLTPRGAAQGT
jgi:hypothetical protein